jgi:hypothetical protein
VRDDEQPGVRELLGTAAANVVAVPVVLGFIALGGVVLAARALVHAAAQALGARDTPRRSGKSRPRQPPPGA